MAASRRGMTLLVDDLAAILEDTPTSPPQEARRTAINTIKAVITIMRTYLFT
jgi:hypothetical protein